MATKQNRSKITKKKPELDFPEPPKVEPTAKFHLGLSQSSTASTHFKQGHVVQWFVLIILMCVLGVVYLQFIGN